MTNKCTIISQIITLLHVSAQSCHPQGACNQYLAKLIGKVLITVTNKCTIISQILTLLHVSAQSCHPQGACNQYLAKLLARYWLLWPTNAQLFHKLSHSYIFRHYRITLRELV